MRITVETRIKAPIKHVWDFWTKPKHITNWNFASDDWCCPVATNDLKPGGEFMWRMEAKNGSMGFDFTGKYEQIIENELISYRMSDGRTVEIRFSEMNNDVLLSESYEGEGTNSDEQQRAGWQSILQNFKNSTEGNLG